MNIFDAKTSSQICNMSKATKYVVFVKNAEESEAVQEALFSAGFIWANGMAMVQNTHSFFLFFDSFFGISKEDDDFIFAAGTVKRDKRVAIPPSAIIENPFELDGAKKPEKEHIINGKPYSESTLVNALRAYIGTETKP